MITALVRTCRLLVDIRACFNALVVAVLGVTAVTAFLAFLASPGTAVVVNQVT